MKLETQTEQLISETVTVYGLSPQIGVHALAQTANALAAQGTVFSVCPDITGYARNICKRQCTDCLSGICVQIQNPQDRKTSEKSM